MAYSAQAATAAKISGVVKENAAYQDATVIGSFSMKPLAQNITANASSPNRRRTQIVATFARTVTGMVARDDPRGVSDVDNVRGAVSVVDRGFHGRIQFSLAYQQLGVPESHVSEGAAGKRPQPSPHTASDCGRLTAHSEVGRAGRGDATMILPGEMEAALRGRNHAEGQSGGLIGTMKRGRGAFACALFQEPRRIGRPRCLENPARRAEYSLTESALSPFQAEPTHRGL